jgi:hypothetical protein
MMRIMKMGKKGGACCNPRGKEVEKKYNVFTL